MPIIRTICRNYSSYPRDVVWDNAQDLEHVPFLHQSTNAWFRMLGVTRAADSEFEYDTMMYEARRKVKFLRISTFGFRRIVRKFNLHQLEYIPLLRVTSALNSLLFETGDAQRPTLLLDEVIMDVPRWMMPLRGMLQRSLQRHAATQCGEDEPFRQRLVELQGRGIKMPYRLFAEATESQLTSLFQMNLDCAPGADEPSNPPTARARQLST
jgi:hypothetical protein